MCGIAGFVGGDWSSSSAVTAILDRMNDSIRHRGPDGSAIWMDSGARIGFAHDRLSIVDLSPAGNQPMDSHGGRYVLSYNGEIYNHREIRGRLSNTPWNGTSDTETLLAAIEHFGVRKAVEMAMGMFAFALWDRKERTLTLARDRVGEKPLYYGTIGGSNPIFLFASELKAIACHPAFTPEVNRAALTLFLRFGYIPAPFSIYQGVHKLRPGSLLVLREGRSEPELETYWSGLKAAESGVQSRLSGSRSELTDELESTLESVIGQHMLADVSVGAFLSGGIDSSTVVALMQKLSPRPVKTFTIGFRETEFNEADDAKAVARHLGTEHSELYVTSQEARSVIPRLPEIYDEPFADSSHIPTYLVAALASQQIRVALTGDGGDELFGGYNRHLVTADVWERISGIPPAARAVASGMLSMIPAAAWATGGKAFSRALPGWVIGHNLTETMRRGLPLLASRSVNDLYRGIVSLWADPASVVIGASEPDLGYEAALSGLQALRPTEQMMALDMVRYLPDDILVKVDRASMAVSLETRVPYLDQRVIELAWRLPFDSKIHGSQTKAILRELLYRYVPKNLVDRPKMGFAAPIGEWLRGPLRDWAESLLDPATMRQQGYLDADVVQKIWRSHLRGPIDEKNRLWVILMFQSWLQAYVTK